jgi:hypothetical protein
LNLSSHSNATASFQWALLILMIPVPRVILQKVTFSLEVPTLKLAALLLQLAGVPVVREGNVITLQSNLVFSFESGIRSLLTPLTVAIIGLGTGVAEGLSWMKNSGCVSLGDLLFARVPAPQSFAHHSVHRS